MTLHLLLGGAAWWAALTRYLDTEAGTEAAADARAVLLRELVAAGRPDPAAALADALLFGPAPAWCDGCPPAGVVRALEADVARVREALEGLDVREAENAPGPPLRELAADPSPEVAALAEALRTEAPAKVVAEALRFRREVGGGPIGRWRALRWAGGALHGVSRPASVDPDRLVGVDRPLARLRANAEAFLEGRPAQHALLYGPRGSGKSTAVRGLLTSYAERGLRLVEVRAHDLTDLPELVEALRPRPERFVLFVDDLSFDAGDPRYQPLKSLLEGSVAAGAENVRLHATSNRRHLLQEHHADRPGPGGDDVHAWDTHQERLALADRFGLLLTFPGADQRAYLAMVRHLARRDGVADADDLEGRALRFARAGNGFSGRTAQQFVEGARAGLA